MSDREMTAWKLFPYCYLWEVSLKVILKPNTTVMRALMPMHTGGESQRLLNYCVEFSVLEGVLLYNLLTNELVLLEESECNNFYGNKYLDKHWFTVPNCCADKEYADLVKWIFERKNPKMNAITHFTIFTTTDCNARCFYCYELGCVRTHMSDEIAQKTVRFIKKHCNGNEVTLNWYGGEPLYNAKVIDIICDGLRAEGIPYHSKMISNGYLFDDYLVRKAVECWNLKKIQITLDGTEKVYNKVKAFIYREGSAYQVVLDNIERLINANIKVSVRMNLDLHNADDLLDLIDELADRFGENNFLSAYAYHIFKGIDPIAELHNEDEWKIRDAAMLRVNEKLVSRGLAKVRGIQKMLKYNHCMADSGNAVTILPNGEVGLCDHHNSDEFIGHIDCDGFDETVISSWKERVADTGIDCGDCFYYPSCTMLKKCGNHSVCYEQYRKERFRAIQNAMLNEYEAWKNSNNTELNEAPEC